MRPYTPPNYLPTPEQIAAECAAIRKTWSASRYRSKFASSTKGPGVQAFASRESGKGVLFKSIEP